jgi:hypothetical protein
MPKGRTDATQHSAELARPHFPMQPISAVILRSIKDLSSLPAESQGCQVVPLNPA